MTTQADSPIAQHLLTQVADAITAAPAATQTIPVQITVPAQPCTPSGIVGDLIDKGTMLVQQFAHVLEQTAPKAWSLAVLGTQAHGASVLHVGLLCLWVVVVCVVLFLALGAIAAAIGDSTDAREAVQILCVMGCVLTGVLTVGFTLGAVVNGLNAHAYAEAHQPEGTLAMDLMQGIAGNTRSR